MKKLIVTLLIAALMLAGGAMAATYTDPDRTMSFEYDDAAFKIDLDDHTDDECMVILDGLDEAWGNVALRLHLREMEDGESFTKAEDFAEMEAALNIKVEQADWNGFKNVFMYTIDDGDSTEQVFIAPIYDDDENEVEAILTINIIVDTIEDEDAAMSRDDAISAVLDSLKVRED